MYVYIYMCISIHIHIHIMPNAFISLWHQNSWSILNNKRSKIPFIQYTLFQTFSVEKVLALGSPQLEGSEHCGIGSWHCLSRTAGGTFLPNSVGFQRLPAKTASTSTNLCTIYWIFIRVFEKSIQFSTRYLQDVHFLTLQWLLFLAARKPGVIEVGGLMRKLHIVVTI